MRALAGFFILPLLALAGEGTICIPVRGSTQSIEQIASTAAAGRPAVLFLPGDGGWRGAAVTMGRTIGSWGYDVYGFDTKKYLESFTQPQRRLSIHEMAADVQLIAARIFSITNKPVVLVGWSQGAAMAVAAAAEMKGYGPVRGIITLGLPARGVLGWDWKATLASMAGREPDQPAFETKPLLERAWQGRIWMIHGSADEYTTPQICRALYQAAAEPKQLREVAGANHRFDGHRDELNRSMREGLEWISSK